jgi:ETFB lysine methyltransferase
MRKAALPFPTRPFTLSTGEQTLRFVMPADQNKVLDTIPDEQYEKERFLPYWTEHWPSASPLCTLLQHIFLTEGSRICELGCGLGVISALLAARGFFTVSTDISHDGCRFADSNISNNGGTPKVVCSDWRCPPFSADFDLVIASDVLYEERWISPIINCIGKLMAPDGKALIADPRRRFWSSFKMEVKRRGLNCRTLQEVEVEAGKATVEILEIVR